LRRAPACETGKEAGFTILEVLISLAVVTIVLAAIGNVTATNTRGVRSIEQHAVLAEAARSVVAGLRSREPLAAEGLSGEMYGNRWHVGASPMVDGPIMVDPQSTWIPQMMTIRVQSPTGAAIDVKTVRLQRRQQ
jgi:general secretion pathway protein I